MFSKKSTQPAAKEERFDFWNQVLYERLFTSESEIQKIQGHRFHCLFSSRRTVIRPGAAPIHEFICISRIVLANNAMAPYALSLRFEEPSLEFNRSVNDLVFGYSSFGWLIHEKQYPSIDLVVRDTNHLGSVVSSLFAEVRAAGGRGLECSWSTRLSPMIGRSAVEVWGDWLTDSPRDENGVLVPGKLPGRHAFSIESLEFAAEA